MRILRFYLSVAKLRILISRLHNAVQLAMGDGRISNVTMSQSNCRSYPHLSYSPKNVTVNAKKNAWIPRLQPTKVVYDFDSI